MLVRAGFRGGRAWGRVSTRPGGACGGVVAGQAVNLGLSTKPSACVVWVVLRELKDAVPIEHILYFGSGPGQPIPPLGDHPGRNPRSKTLRPNTRVLPKSRFAKLGSVTHLYERLFGPQAAQAGETLPADAPSDLPGGDQASISR